MSCSGKGCTSTHIQNKKYNLCSNCVFKKNHGGKSQGEVYSERAKSRETVKELESCFRDEFCFDSKPILGQELQTDDGVRYVVDEQGHLNARNQYLAEQEAKKETKKKPKPLKQISKKQGEIERKYKLTCIDMDYTTEPVCTGCNRYQGGDIVLSHSHLISRKQCKEIGREELIYERLNLKFHCMDFGEHTGCHRKWENPKQRHTLLDYQENIKIVEQLAPEVLQHFI